jgi:tetratricopeptide (TPR) repeat protein
MNGRNIENNSIPEQSRFPKERGLMKNISKFTKILNVYRQLPEISRAVFELIFVLISLAILCTSAAAEENTTEYWMNTALAFSHNGSNEKAISAYDEVLKIDPENVSAWRHKALELQVLGKENESIQAYEMALSLMDESLKGNPDDAKTWHLKSLTLEDLGRPQESLKSQEKALQIYNRSLEQNPKNISSWRGKAEILYRMGKTDESLQALDNALEINPEDLDILSRKGEFLEFDGRYNESLEVFDRLLELMPADDVRGRVEVLMAKVQTLDFADRRSEAAKALDNVTKLDPKNVATWRMKAGYLEELGRYNESLAAYEQALQVDPDDVLTWSYKASQLAEQKRYNESLLAYDRAIELLPSGDSKELAAAWVGKGDALNKTGQNDEARKAFVKAVEASDRALAKDPGDISLMLLKAEAQFKLNEYDEAVKSYDSVIEMSSSPDSFYAASAWIGKGDVMHAQGKNAEAMQAYDNAIDLNPMYSNAWQGKGEAQRALGLVQDAYESSYVAEKLGYEKE